MNPNFIVVAILIASHDLGLSNPAPVLSDFVNLKIAIELYQNTTGELPPPGAGFNSLVERPQTLPADRKWVRIMDRIPRDPWEKPYQYLVGDGFPLGYGIYSKGPDGNSATQGNDADDYNSWSPDHRGMETDLRKSLLLLWPSVAVGCLTSFCFGVMIARNRNGCHALK